MGLLVNRGIAGKISLCLLVFSIVCNAGLVRSEDDYCKNLDNVKFFSKNQLNWKADAGKLILSDRVIDGKVPAVGRGEEVSPEEKDTGIGDSFRWVELHPSSIGKGKKQTPNLETRKTDSFSFNEPIYGLVSTEDSAVVVSKGRVLVFPWGKLEPTAEWTNIIDHKTVEVTYLGNKLLTIVGNDGGVLFLNLSKKDGLQKISIPKKMQGQNRRYQFDRDLHNNEKIWFACIVGQNSKRTETTITLGNFSSADKKMINVRSLVVPYGNISIAKLTVEEGAIALIFEKGGRPSYTGNPIFGIRYWKIPIDDFVSNNHRPLTQADSKETTFSKIVRSNINYINNDFAILGSDSLESAIIDLKTGRFRLLAKLTVHLFGCNNKIASLAYDKKDEAVILSYDNGWISKISLQE